MCVILGGPVQSIPSLCLLGLVSAIPCAPLTSCGPSWTKVQVHDREKVQRVDHDAGDTIHSSGLMTLTADQQDATFVQVSNHIL